MSVLASDLINELEINTLFGELTEAQQLQLMGSAVQESADLYYAAGKIDYLRDTLAGATVPLNGLTAVWYVDAGFSVSDANLRKVKTITEALGSNRFIFVAPGTYSETVNISDYTSLKIVGLGKPQWNGTTVTGGVIITSAATSKTVTIQNNCRGVCIENIGVINTSTGDALGAVGYPGVTIRDLTLRDVITVLPTSSGHGLLFEEAGGTILQIHIENCKCYNGNHGIIFKAKDAMVLNCYVENALIYSYAAISDNIVAAARLSTSRNITFKKCIAKRTSTYAGSRGFQVYCVDFFSETNANSVVAVNNVLFEDCYAEALEQGFTIARSSGAFVFPKIATGQSQVAPVSIKMIGCKAHDNDAEGIVTYYGTDILCLGVSAMANGGVGFQESNATTPRAIACYALGNSDDTFTGWTTTNV